MGLGAPVQFRQHYGVDDVLIENSRMGQRHHKIGVLAGVAFIRFHTAVPGGGASRKRDILHAVFVLHPKHECPIGGVRNPRAELTLAS